MNNRTVVTIKKTILGLFIVLGFFTPLIFSSTTAEMYEFPKMIFVYIAGTTLIFVWSLHALIFRTKKFVKPDIEVLGYVGLTLVSVVLSSHLYTSVWGYYSRFNGGAASVLVLFGIYFVGINFLDRERSEKLKDFLCLGLFPVSLYGIFQIFNHDRIFSTLGQPNWFAAYLVFIMPLLFDRIITSKDKLKRNFWIFTFITSFVSLWFTYSLSGMAGFVAGFFYIAFKFRKKVINKWAALIVLALFGFTLFNLNFFKDRISDALILSTDPRSYQISDPGLIRLGLWKGSMNIALSGPKNLLFGIGPETFPYEFPFFREDFLNYSSEWNFILNKPHNYYLEILVESGIITLLFYLAILIKAMKKKDIYLKGGLIGFYVTNIFGWPTVTTALLFWIWLALLNINTSR